MISVVIPVYNGELFLDNIFNQLERQTYSELELILVDDGSVDGSNRKIQQCVSSSSLDVKVIIQTNQGQGAARNRGIKEANGEYIAFIDQDDVIKDDYFEKLIEVANTRKSDIVVSGYYVASNKGRIKRKVVLKDEVWGKFMNITPWGKLYRLDFIRKNKIEFLPVPLGEDVYFNVKAYSLSEKVQYIRYVGYSWVENDKSFSRTEHNRLDNGIDLFPLLNALISMETSANWMKKKEYEYFIMKTILYHLIIVFKKTPIGKVMNYRKKLINWLKKHFPDYKNNPLVGIWKPKGENLAVRILMFIVY